MPDILHPPRNITVRIPEAVRPTLPCTTEQYGGMDYGCPRYIGHGIHSRIAAFIRAMTPRLRGKTAITTAAMVSSRIMD